MAKKILKIIGYSLLICILIFSFEIFYPISYHVPSFERRINTQYWNLASGSKIGYSFISASGQKKPFPIIYLHGGPGGYITNYDIHVFNSIADSGYDVYLYDQIGSGQSKRLADIKITQ